MSIFGSLYDKPAVMKTFSIRDNKEIRKYSSPCYTVRGTTMANSPSPPLTLRGGMQTSPFRDEGTPGELLLLLGRRELWGHYSSP